MRPGWYISGAGHVGLFLMVVFGGLLTRSEPPELSVADVSIISEAEFAALSAPPAGPTISDAAPDVTAPVEDSSPETPDADAAPDLNQPDPVAAPDAPEETPETLPEPVPDALVEDNAPVIDTPDTDIDGSSPLPDATPAPAPRVAPVPAIAPPPLADVAPDVVEDTAPDPEAEPVAEPEEEQDPAAPEEASDRIVTEAEETPDLAPATSARPRSRPARPVRTAEDDAPEDARDDIADAVAAAVAEANQAAPDVPAGPPLTGGEKDALRISVQQCWNVGSLSTEALGTTVVVGVEMARDGKPNAGSIRLISSSGGSDAAARQAYEAARRAIIRCGARGFPLPVEKYAEWQDIEMTFNPEGMQFR